MTREELIARLVAIADERPNVSIGHVVEHELPELRAQAEAMNNGAAQSCNGGGSPHACETEKSGPETAAAPPEYYCNKCHYLGPQQTHDRPNGTGACNYLASPINGAAQGNATSESSRRLESHEAGRASGESSTALGRAEDPPSQASPVAAPPSALQPVAEVLGERCIDGGKCHHACSVKCFRRECCSPLSGYAGPWAYTAPPDLATQPVAWNDLANYLVLPWSVGLDDPPQGWAWDRESGHWIAPDDYMSGLYTAPPDLAARARELEELLQETQQFGAFGVGSTLANRIRAALAKGE